MSEVPIGSIYRRDFLGKLGRVSLGAAAVGALATPAVQARPPSVEKIWEPVSGRKVPVGIVAHQSALKDGERLTIPQFARPGAVGAG